jgi:DNA-binding CsgD family transcriptional regulator
MPSTAGLVGRGAEFDLLGEWIDDVVNGAGRAALLEGEPGIGKSSVARVAARFAEERGCQVYWAAADELGHALPLRPLLDALSAGDSAEEPRLVTIRRLLRGEFAGVVDPAVAASEQMLALVAELCTVAPTVLVVDDLQWADPATIGVWDRLARSVDRSALLLIGIVRPVPQRPELLAVRRVICETNVVQLDGLSGAEVAQLVAQLVGGTPGADLLKLAAEAAGNPLYLTEITDAFLRDRRLDATDAGVVCVSDGAAPVSLFGAIVDRLDFLSRDTRRVLRAAALLGAEFLVADLAAVLNCRVVDLLEAIDLARTAGVLIDASEKLVFRHPLIRAALYDEIAEAVRPAWHQEAAKALADAGAPIDRVAQQLLRAMSVPGACLFDESLLRWLVEAASTLVAQAPALAIDLLRQAIHRSPANTSQGAVLACRLADALYRSGECADAEQVAARAMAVVTDHDLLVDLHGTVSQCRAMLGRTNEALESLTLARQLPGISTRQRARLLVLTARAHRGLGEVAVAGQVGAEALAAAEEAGDTWAVGWSLHVLIIVSIMQGDVLGALPLFDRALDAVVDDPTLVDLSLLLQINKAVALGDLDRYEQALEEARRVRQLADHTGSLVRLAQAQSALGELLFEVGRWDDAQVEVEMLSDDFKDPGATCCDRGVVAVIAFHRGDETTARRHLSLAARSAEQIGNRVVGTLSLARSLDHEMAKELDKALAVLTAGLAGEAEELDEMEDLLPEAARIAAYANVRNVAADVAERAVALALHSKVPHRRAAAAYCRGLLDGNPVLLQNAAEGYRDAGRPLLRAMALEAAAVRLADDGDRSSARTAFIQADELYTELGASWDLARLRVEFRRHGMRRGSRAKHRQARVGWDSLTSTETKVAVLVAEGLSNRLIAERLVLSTRTVDTHVSHILGKLGMRSRVAIAREVNRARG